MPHLTIPGGLPRAASGRWVVLDVVRRSTGRGRIRSTVELYGVPTGTFVRRRVRLYRETDGTLLREVWSHAITGVFDFQWIDENGTYTVIVYDHGSDRRRAAVADGLTLASGAVEMMS